MVVSHLKWPCLGDILILFGQNSPTVANVKDVYGFGSEDSDKSSGTTELSFLGLIVQKIGVGLFDNFFDDGFDWENCILVLDLLPILPEKV